MLSLSPPAPRRGSSSSRSVQAAGLDSARLRLCLADVLVQAGVTPSTQWWGGFAKHTLVWLPRLVSLVWRYCF